MEKQSMMVAAVAIGVVMIVGGMVWSADKEKLRLPHDTEDKGVIAMAAAATITIDEAIKTALENFPGKAIEAELEKKQDRTFWEVTVLTAEQGLMQVLVDAESGSVITTGEKDERTPGKGKKL
jgi:uncharacterized membrane protein YkoI